MSMNTKNAGAISGKPEPPVESKPEAKVTIRVHRAAKGPKEDPNAWEEVETVPATVTTQPTKET